ncbi:hypothetical protein C8J57DRAFT_1245471 [Mycena rebaudengoi]|nr:hypothetical protein C8J57DRAFT_1245471 [Mycena rebaudengoi]
MLRAPLILSLFHLAPYLRALRLPLLFSPSHCALRPFPALDLSLRHLLKEGVSAACGACVIYRGAQAPTGDCFERSGGGYVVGKARGGGVLIRPSPVVNAGGPLLIQQLPYNAFESSDRGVVEIPELCAEIHQFRWQIRRLHIRGRADGKREELDGWWAGQTPETQEMILGTSSGTRGGRISSRGNL